jgi:hypothetical protein
MVSVNSTKIDWRSITDINVISPRPPWQQPPPASLPFLRPPLHPAARLGQAFRAQTPPPCVGRRPGVFCIKCLVKPPHSPATKSSVSSTRRHASQGLCFLAPSAANPPLASRFWRRPQLKQHSYALMRRCHAPSLSHLHPPCSSLPTRSFIPSSSTAFTK